MVARGRHRTAPCPDGMELTTVTNRFQHAAAVEEVRHAEVLVRDDLPTMARGFVADENSFALLGRYEVGIERRLYGALHELEHLQADRADARAEPPAVVDVQVASADR